MYDTKHGCTLYMSHFMYFGGADSWYKISCSLSVSISYLAHSSSMAIYSLAIYSKPIFVYFPLCLSHHLRRCCCIHLNSFMLWEVPFDCASSRIVITVNIRMWLISSSSSLLSSLAPPAIDDNAQLTDPLGLQMAEFPLSPMFAHMLLKSGYRYMHAKTSTFWLQA